MRNWFSSNGYHWQSNPVLTVYPWGLAGWLLNTGWPLAERDAKKKHHFDLTVLERKTFELKVLTLVREINMENLTWEIIIGFFFWCFRFRWPFNTSGKQYKWKTIQRSHWDSVKGDHDRLIKVVHKEVKIKILERKKFRNFDKRPLINRSSLNTVPLNSGSAICCIKFYHSRTIKIFRNGNTFSLVLQTLESLLLVSSSAKNNWPASIHDWIIPNKSTTKLTFILEISENFNVLEYVTKNRRLYCSLAECVIR